MTPSPLSLARARADISSALDLGQLPGATTYASAETASPDAAQGAMGVRDVAVDLLYARDWLARAAAIGMAVRRGATSDIVSRLVQMAIDDEVREVRGLALIALADLLNGDEVMGKRICTALTEAFPVHLRVDSEWARDVSMFWLSSVCCEVLCERGRREYLSDRMEQFAKLAGPHAWTLLRGQGTAYKFLDHGDPNLRAAALDTISQAKNMAIWAGTKVMAMAAMDIDYGVRIAAAGACGSIFAKTKDRGVERFLASIVMDVSQHTYIREIAYHALYRVHDMPVSEWPDCKAAASLPRKIFTFPDDANMDFVQACLRGV